MFELLDFLPVDFATLGWQQLFTLDFWASGLLVAFDGLFFCEL
jgi:hypothetical protein